ncbi:nadph-dependent fmn reductase [Trichococcus palustris]|uniref:Nadph-dependent fmn reductase n=2 Tax=Trichococcus palustris TaxID=140314 RepID=A0A143YYC1_9LACT|nr:nadph-dependent fmn reductase [Trichococcus palustris]SFK93965.1 NAD(P)H-dependent FMN reductase [Trichococcus palustris]
MKFLGIVGSTSDISFNRILLKYIQRRFDDKFELQLVEVKDFPLFNQDIPLEEVPLVSAVARKIEAADGIIIATPEHNHTISAALKSFLEWMSSDVHPFDGKPVMIVGASYFAYGSSRAQLHLRQVLDAPGVNAVVLPGNEFLLGDVKKAFDDFNNLKDPGTVKFLENCLDNFVRFVKIINQVADKNYVEKDVSVWDEELPNIEVDVISGASESY